MARLKACAKCARAILETAAECDYCGHKMADPVDLALESCDNFLDSAPPLDVTLAGCVSENTPDPRVAAKTLADKPAAPPASARLDAIEPELHRNDLVESAPLRSAALHTAPAGSTHAESASAHNSPGEAASDLSARKSIKKDAVAVPSVVPQAATLKPGANRRQLTMVVAGVLACVVVIVAAVGLRGSSSGTAAPAATPGPAKKPAKTAARKTSAPGSTSPAAAPTTPAAGATTPAAASTTSAAVKMPSTPTAPAQPVAALPVGAPKWSTANSAVWVGKDRRAVAFEVNAINRVQVWMRTVRPTLVVRCVARKPEVLVYTNSAAKMETQDEDHSVTFAFDNESMVRDRWPDSAEHDGLFAPDPSQFIERLKSASVLRFGFTPHNSEPVVATFDVAGLDALLAPAAKQCGLKK